MRVLFALAFALPFAGCAASGPALLPSSHVDADLAPSDVPALSAGVAAFVALRQPPGPILLQGPATDLAGLGDRIAADLRAAGQVVSATGRNRLSYRIGRHGERDVLVRVALDDARGARVLTRDPAGALVPSGPYTLSLAGDGR